MEWKRQRHLPQRVFLPALETFLGGMETQHLGERLLLVCRLETFLGGMETLDGTDDAWGQVAP